MKVTPLSIPDVLLIEPHVFEDSRGFFFESFNLEDFQIENYQSHPTIKAPLSN